eukprot:g38591.t1
MQPAPLPRKDRVTRYRHHYSGTDRHGVIKSVEYSSPDSTGGWVLNIIKADQDHEQKRQGSGDDNMSLIKRQSRLEGLNQLQKVTLLR